MVVGDLALSPPKESGSRIAVARGQLSSGRLRASRSHLVRRGRARAPEPTSALPPPSAEDQCRASGRTRGSVPPRCSRQNGCFTFAPRRAPCRRDPYTTRASYEDAPSSTSSSSPSAHGTCSTSCLTSLRASPPAPGARTWVVENASRTERPSMVRSGFPRWSSSIRPTNLGFAAANNLAIRRGRRSIRARAQPGYPRDEGVLTITSGSWRRTRRSASGAAASCRGRHIRPRLPAIVPDAAGSAGALHGHRSSAIALRPARPVPRALGRAAGRSTP